MAPHRPRPRPGPSDAALSVMVRHGAVAGIRRKRLPGPPWPGSSGSAPFTIGRVRAVNASTAVTTVTTFTDADRRLDGRTAVVTGAASGIGRAVARTLSDLGARVALFDLSTEVDSVAKVLTAAGRQARAWAVDVGDTRACAQAVGQVSAVLGPIDVLVN